MGKGAAQTAGDELARLLQHLAFALITDYAAAELFGMKPFHDLGEDGFARDA